MSIFLTNVFNPLLPSSTEVLAELGQLLLKNYFITRSVTGQ